MCMNVTQLWCSKSTYSISFTPKQPYFCIFIAFPAGRQTMGDMGGIWTLPLLDHTHHLSVNLGLLKYVFIVLAPKKTFHVALFYSTKTTMRYEVKRSVSMSWSSAVLYCVLCCCFFFSPLDFPPLAYNCFTRVHYTLLHAHTTPACFKSA